MTTNKQVRKDLSLLQKKNALERVERRKAYDFLLN